MIPVPSNVRVWIATGHTDMRRGMNGLALQVQEGLNRDPHAGDLYIFRGKKGDLIKILWHDGVGLSLYAKRLERGRFVWPVTNGGPVAITPAQMGYMLEAIDWRNPQHTRFVLYSFHGFTRCRIAGRHRRAEGDDPGNGARTR